MKTCALLLCMLLTLLGRPAWAEDDIVTGPDRRDEIDLRLEALDARRAEISTDGPKAATVIGLIGVIGGGIAIGVGATCTDQFDECGDQVAAVVGGITLIGLGAATALIGGIMWQTRVNRRNEIDAERESLMKERDGLAAALSRLELRSPRRDRTQFVTLGVRF